MSPREMLFAEVSVVHILVAGCCRMQRGMLPDASEKSPPESPTHFTHPEIPTDNAY